MLSLVLLLAFCSLGASQSNIATGISNFAFDFYKECAETPGDIVISPFSVASVLTLLAQGANGTTLEQLQKNFFPNIDKTAAANEYNLLYSSINSNRNKNATLSLVNQIYTRKGLELNPAFEEVAVKKFASRIDPLDFSKADESAQAINEFVKNSTHGKILDIVKSSDINDDTQLYLVNAIYFKANWEKKFDKSLTKKGDFHANNNQLVPVDYMHMSAKLTYGEWNKQMAETLELRYADSPYSFVIVLPNKGNNLTSLEKRISAEDLNSFLQMYTEEAEVEAQIPKFAIEYEVDLKDVLEKLNIGEMFKFNTDLSGLFRSSNKELRVSKAVHKAVIEVNEDGSEAAGATAIALENRMLMSTRQVKFVADRPFMYFIRDSEQEVILFSGRLENFKAEPAFLRSSSSHLTTSIFVIVTVLFSILIN